MSKFSTAIALASFFVSIIASANITKSIEGRYEWRKQGVIRTIEIYRQLDGSLAMKITHNGHVFLKAVDGQERDYSEDSNILGSRERYYRANPDKILASAYVFQIAGDTQRVEEKYQINNSGNLQVDADVFDLTDKKIGDYSLNYIKL